MIKSAYRGSGDQKSGQIGPFIKATPFLHAEPNRPVPLLGIGETTRLAQIGDACRFVKGAILYEEGQTATCVYNLADGNVKLFSPLSSGRHPILAFVGGGDLIGLAENGRYVSTAEAITAVRAYRLPLTELDKLLRRDSELEHSFLCKLCHELRAARLHAIMLGRHDAEGKLAMFIAALDAKTTTSMKSSMPIYLPMTRSDIAAYLGLSLEAVSRSFRKLQLSGIIKFNDRHNLEIVDRDRFERIAVPL
jgi:CRP-like cAMP-binding protein